LLDFNLAVLPTVFFFLFADFSDFVVVAEMLGIIVFMAGSISRQFQLLQATVLTFSMDQGNQNGLDVSNPASQRERPISRRVLSLRFINSWRERARLRHSAT
jgi:hypothetical protein